MTLLTQFRFLLQTKTRNSIAMPHIESHLQNSIIMFSKRLIGTTIIHRDRQCDHFYQYMYYFLCPLTLLKQENNKFLSLSVILSQLRFPDFFFLSLVWGIDLKLAVQIYNEKLQIRFEFFYDCSKDDEEINLKRLVFFFSNRVLPFKKSFTKFSKLNI